MEAIRFGTDGWRARYGEGFDELNVARVADAAARMFARVNPEGTLYIGYDTRLEGVRYAEVAAEAAAGHGLDVVLSDVCCPTPALGWTVARDPNAVGGLMLTASHNAADYNGIKVRMADGGASPKDFTDALELSLEPEPSGAAGSYRRGDVMGPYIDDLKRSVDGEAIEGARLKIVVDPLFGSARGYLARVLREFGVEVAEMHNADDPGFDGMNPEPVEPWTAPCRDLVVRSEAHAGIVVDGDGDRIGAIDESGRLLSAHTVIALVLGALARAGKTGRVVVTTSGSVLVRRQAARLGCPVTETPIGFKWVYGEMLKGGVLLGGEESGGIGIPDHLMERDGLYVALLLCELMAKTGKTLGRLAEDLADQVGHMEYGRRDLRLDGASLQMFLNMLPGLNPQRVAGMRPVEVSHKDGLRLRFADDSWLLVRPSGTEPLIRVYAEAPTVVARDALLDAGCAMAMGEPLDIEG